MSELAAMGITNYNRTKNTDICPVEDNAVERTYDQTLVELYL